MQTKSILTIMIRIGRDNNNNSIKGIINVTGSWEEEEIISRLKNDSKYSYNKLETIPKLLKERSHWTIFRRDFRLYTKQGEGHTPPHSFATSSIKL